ncbi:MAG TPA: STAS domain-containing protein [Aromatoleum sp.]|uniref:STAS domain-containing protein n=1 Tax=Aromatoleum sp. TaxID=2307007 RepID=UPI002B47433A|nr:STAS domain-containing protein [Aromatoleum sp.]HJV25007.1 STAS domain-containing protein [Aromatoleum sp.]
MLAQAVGSWIAAIAADNGEVRAMNSSTLSDAVNERPTRFRPEGELTIYTVAERHRELMSALEAGRAVDLDLSAVNEVDCAGLQLLILATREAGRRGIGYRVAACSDAVKDALETIQLVGLVDDCARHGGLPRS